MDRKHADKPPVISNYRATVATLQGLWLDYDQGGYQGAQDVENWGRIQSGFNDKWGYVFD